MTAPLARVAYRGLMSTVVCIIGNQNGTDDSWQWAIIAGIALLLAGFSEERPR